MEIQKHELWDLYDKDRNKLNKTVWRDEAHQKLKENGNEFHIVVNVYITNGKGDILITQRHPNKNYGRLWEVTGGSITSGENSRLGAKRELEEEIGLSIQEDELILLYSYIDNRNCAIYDIYALVREDIIIENLELQEDEVIDAKFVSYEEFNGFVDDGQFFNYPDCVRFKLIKDNLTQLIYKNTSNS